MDAAPSKQHERHNADCEQRRKGRAAQQRASVDSGSEISATVLLAVSIIVLYVMTGRLGHF